MKPPGVEAPVQAGPAAVLFIALAATLGGCDDATQEVRAEQPIAFSHEKHLAYFSSGAHRKEMIGRHLAELEVEEDEVPPMIAKGLCNKCHADLEKNDQEEKTHCAGCHAASQDPAARPREDVRACVGCHRQAWTGPRATIPSAVVCRSCHGPLALTDSPEEKRLLEYFAAGQDLPWVRIHRLGSGAHFSHVHHVRFEGMACTACHEDMTQKSSPPDRVQVFSMDRCLDCHDEKEADTNCIACHQ